MGLPLAAVETFSLQWSSSHNGSEYGTGASHVPDAKAQVAPPLTQHQLPPPLGLHKVVPLA